MHQSRKEQSFERASRRLLHADRREAELFASLESDMESSEEWEGLPKHNRRDRSGRL